MTSQAVHKMTAVRTVMVSGSRSAGTVAPGSAFHGRTRDNIQPITNNPTQPSQPVMERASDSGITQASAELSQGAQEPPEM